MKHLLTALTIASTMFCSVSHAAITDKKAKPVAKQATKQQAKSAAKQATKQVAKRAAILPAAAALAPLAQQDNIDLASAQADNFDCELGHKVVVYKHPNDDQRITVRWQNQLKQLTRVPTSSGANRYENEQAGLLWINIPAKAMLLDSKQGRQLANECKSKANLVAMSGK